MSTWTLAYDSFNPEEEGLREALTSVGNGFFSTRGAAEWTAADDVHYPGTYMHGGFDRASTMMAGRPVVNEDLVNLPNWLMMQLRIEDDEPISLSNVEVLSYRHELDMRNAVVARSLRFRDRAGRETTLASRRFISMADLHQAGLEWTITAENWSGKVEVISGLDGRVTNWGVARYRELESRHMNAMEVRTLPPDRIALLSQTRQSGINVAEAARTRVYGEHEVLSIDRVMLEREGYAHQSLAFRIQEQSPVRVEKMVAFYTSRDHAVSEPLVNAEQAVARYDEFAEALERHVHAWENLWAISDIRIPKDDHVQQLVRFHIYHVLQVCSPHTADLDAGVPARGLNGEAYRGHVFWDELYIYPFINYRIPDVTRGLLMYRYRRLAEARAAAKEHGYRGAMYPWQSGSDGTEETQTVHLNPKSGRWDPDLSHNQRHVNAAIFYNIWQYYQATDDIRFVWDHGAEMMLEIARFWASIAHFNPERGKYEIHGVMGPDEFHEKLFGSEEEGVRNNAYTNFMVAWISEIALKVLELLPERRRGALCAKIGLAEDEINTWNEMKSKMFVPVQKDGIVSQFDGYENLQELDWEAYRRKYDNIHRMDRLLKAEGDTPDRYKLAKQADTVMLWYLFPENELRSLFARLGVPYDSDTADANIKYYEARCSHGSTLSLIVHAEVEGTLDPENSWKMFTEALESDVGDVQGGTTKEGIHMGVMAGTLDLIQRGYTGTEVRDDVLYFNPKPIEQLEGISFPMVFRDTPIHVSLEGGKLTVNVQSDGLGKSIKVGLGDQVCDLEAGHTCTFDL